MNIYFKYYLEVNVLFSYIHKSVQRIIFFCLFPIKFPVHCFILEHYIDVISKGVRKHLHSSNYSWPTISMILSRS